MFFRLNGLKEEETTKQLDFLIGGGDMDFIKLFCESKGLVILNLKEWKGNVSQFGNIEIQTVFDEKNVTLIGKGSKLEESTYFFIHLGIDIATINFVVNKIPQNVAHELLVKVALKVKKEREAKEEEKENLEKQEAEQFEDKNLAVAIKIIDNNIHRLEQLLKIGATILPGSDRKALETFLNELKKIKLGNNLNKMAIMLNSAQDALFKAEDFVLKALDDKKFRIDPNSEVTNVDVITSYNTLISAEEKHVLDRKLTLKEQIYLMFKKSAIFLHFFAMDLQHSLKDSKLVVDQLVEVGEFFLIVLIVIFAVYTFEPLLPNSGNMVMLLPLAGLIGIALGIYTVLRKMITSQLLSFCVCCTCLFGAWQGFMLLRNTFAF